MSLSGRARFFVNIFCVVYVFGVFFWPYEQLAHGEAYAFYVSLLENPFRSAGDLVSGITQPGYFALAKFLQSVFPLDSTGVVLFIRVIALAGIVIETGLLAIGMARRYIPLNAQKHWRIGTLSVWLLIMDFTFSYHIVGDQFRQLLGMWFFLMSIRIYVRKGLSIWSIFAGLIALMCHKMFYFFLPFLFLVGVYNSYFAKNRIGRWLVAACLSIFGLIIGKELFSYIVPQIRDEVNYVKDLGIWAGLVTKPGVWVAIAHYSFIFYWLIKNKRSWVGFHLPVVIFGYMLILFFMSKVNILGISFVEPARIYSIMAPFTAVLLSFVWYISSSSGKLLLVSEYFTYNLVMNNFSGGHFLPLLILVDTSLLDVLDVNFGGDALLFKLTLFSILILIIFYLLPFPNKFIKLWGSSGQSLKEGYAK